MEKYVVRVQYSTNKTNTVRVPYSVRMEKYGMCTNTCVTHLANASIPAVCQLPGMHWPGVVYSCTLVQKLRVVPGRVKAPHFVGDGEVIRLPYSFSLLGKTGRGALWACFLGLVIIEKEITLGTKVAGEPNRLATVKGQLATSVPRGWDRLPIRQQLLVATAHYLECMLRTGDVEQV